MATATTGTPAGTPGLSASPTAQAAGLPATPTPVPTDTPTATNTPTATSTATPTGTATPTSTATPSPTPTLLSTAAPQPTRPAVPVAAEEVVRGDPDRSWLSLVFNAGAGFPPAPAILDTLHAKGVRTTFFLMGWWAEREPDLVRRMAADGHEIASHGYRIFDLTQASDAEVIADLERAETAIQAITGRTTRPLWSPSAGYRDSRVRQLAASLGYRPIYWTVDSGDWRRDVTAEEVRGRVLSEAINGAIIVMHFDSPRTADTIAAGLPGIVDELRAAGYRLVTVSELITGQLDGAD